MPTFASYGNNTLGTTLKWIITKNVNVTMNTVVFFYIFPVRFFGAKLDVMSSEIPPTLKIILNQLLKNVFFHCAPPTVGVDFVDYSLIDNRPQISPALNRHRPNRAEGDSEADGGGWRY